MSIPVRSIWQLQVFSLIVLIVPMVIYPMMLGTELQKFVLTHLLYELLFYFIVTFVLYRQVTFFQATQISGICIIYRLVLGCAFSFLLAAVHSMSINVAIALGMYSYLPGLLLHIVATPLLLKPVLDGIYAESFKERSFRVVETSALELRNSRTSSIAHSRERKTIARPLSRPLQNLNPLKRQTDLGVLKETQQPAGELNGFDKATKYVGEDATVRLAAIIDNEGLLLSHFVRGGIVAEDIAPFALAMAAACAEIIDRITSGVPERLEFTLKEYRIVLAIDSHSSLIVIAERRPDDLLNVRINQAIEMIRKYMSERYSAKLHPTMEKSYA